MKIKYAEFGKRLADLRKAKGLKQKDCLMPLGEPTLQMLCSWEKGYSFPSFNYLRNISKFYNVSLDYLVFGTMKDGPRFEITKYSELFNLIIQLVESTVFNLNISNSKDNELRPVSLSSFDSIVSEFCLKFERLANSKDLYGESKYLQALDELINSYSDITIELPY